MEHSVHRVKFTVLIKRQFHWVKPRMVHLSTNQQCRVGEMQRQLLGLHHVSFYRHQQQQQ